MPDRYPPRLLSTMAPLVAIAALCVAAAESPATQGPPAKLDASRFMAHVRFLSSDDLAGRANGSRGLERAAAYIADALEDSGLSPGGPDGYYQPFEVKVGSKDDPGDRLPSETSPGRAAERDARVEKQVHNVIGTLRGADPARSPEAIVIGAHYDHLGIGGRHSRAPGAAGEVHNGADDNASGTAALLELARVSAMRRHEFPRTLVFVAFAAEELGLLGSSFYTRNPTVALERTVAMINLDMIGRANGRVLVSGLEDAPGLEADLAAAAEGLPMRAELFSEGPGDGASDDSSFSAHGVPAIGFFSGFHDDYHRPTDDWELIDVDGSLNIATLAFELTRRIANRMDRVEFR